MNKFIKKNWLKIVIVVVAIILVAAFVINNLRQDSNTREYISQDQTQCAATTWVCTEEMQQFYDETGCGCEPIEPRKENNTNTQIANPASVNCIEKGGNLSIVDKPEGQLGMCTLSDGTVCEEWAYFRGECPK